MSLEPYIAQTDSAWFDFLYSRSNPETSRVDEVNFWSPSSKVPLKRLDAGAPVFLRLKKGREVIAGYGFHAAHVVMSLRDAWQTFDWRNGDPDEVRFLQRIGRYRRIDLVNDRSAPRDPIGCTILRDVRFWPESRWIPWGAAQGWKPQAVRGGTERDPARASRLLSEISFDHAGPPEDLDPEPFQLLDVDERRLANSLQVQREGQGTFRARLLRAYGSRCAVTGEHTEIVLDAAHIQPYLGPRSNHPQNGLLLTKEFHALFDAGYVTVTPEHEVRVSARLYREWGNGHRYKPFDGGSLLVLPSVVAESPSAEALDWHGRKRFLG
jgi:putative restriction endonuclease